MLAIDYNIGKDAYLCANVEELCCHPFPIVAEM
jgi:hypothetical protein